MLKINICDPLPHKHQEFSNLHNTVSALFQLNGVPNNYIEVKKHLR